MSRYVLLLKRISLKIVKKDAYLHCEREKSLQYK